ncbi:carboxypeptidase-like regulatory domain-containing protein [Patescibacteria group bacterium]|nr:carboxypeptidase-like regulatory domain-containing protein [Patescibacteria group bacterium]
MNLIDKIETFFLNLSLLKKVAILLVILFVVIVFGSSILISSTKEKSASKEDSQILKTWEITLSYNTKTNTLSSKKIELLNKKVTQDFRSAEFSKDELVMYDSNKNVIYSTKFNITRQLLYMLSNEPSATGEALPPQSETLDTIIYIPYYKNGTKIVIKENGENILEIPISQKISFDLFKIDQASAQTTSSCNPLTVVFISDNYQSFDSYHNDVDIFKQVYISTQPFSESPNIFDFKVLDNSEALGCQNGILNCIKNPRIKQIVARSYSNFSKIVVVANAPRSNSADGGALGVANGIGGDLAVFPNNYGNITGETKIVAGHEFLGHLVGLLYDRYVSSSTSYGGIQGNIRSNCTDKSAGEVWWQQVGGISIYKGCGNVNNYAPTQATCGTRNSRLISAGTPTSMMSAVGCGGNQFDPVELRWIKDNVISKYSSCSGTSQPTSSTTIPPTPTTGGNTSGSGPTPPPNLKLPVIKGTVYVDNNSNSQPDPGEGFQGGVVSLSGPYNVSTSSDANGSFIFEQIPTGTYTISARIGMAIFEPSKEFNVNSGSIITADFGVPPQTSGGNNPSGGGSKIAPTAVPGGSGGGGSTGTTNPSNLLTPTPKIYKIGKCEFDSSCLSTNQNSIQACSLKCNAK